MGEDGQPTTLYVGNLDPSVTEEFILTLFNNIGPVKGCKIIRETAGGDPYCFVEFVTNTSATTALGAMNQRNFMGRQLKVNWANSGSGGTGAGRGGGGGGGPGGAHMMGGAVGGGGGGGQGTLPPIPQGKVDTSQHHHIFVGDLGPEVETDALRNAFSHLGDISDCRVVKDATGKSKGYGFVSFVNKTDAQTAIEQMNGHWLGSRSIRTNWATRKPPAPMGNGAMGGGMGGGGGGRFENGQREMRPLDYDTVFSQASAVNFTVYCGGLLNGDDDLIRRTFSPFGRIEEVRYFRDKGYAFIRYDNKESACNAIVAVHGTEVNNNLVKCSWGKENGGKPPMERHHYNNGGDHSNFGGAPPQAPQQGGGFMAMAAPPQQQFYQQQQYYMYNPQMQMAAAAAPQQYGFAPAAAAAAYGFAAAAAASGAAAYDQGYNNAQPPPQ